MGKQKNPSRTAENEAMAKARMLRTSPQKLNLVAALIRGKKVDRALADLTFSKKRIADDVRKCLQSAIANAENNHNLDVDELVVAEAYVGKNLVMKRGPPAGARPLRTDRQAVLGDHHQGPSGRGASVMGQKVNPIGMRLQVNRTWDSRWFANTKEYGDLLLEDLEDPRLHPRGGQAGRRQPHHHRASAPQVPGDDPHRASGRHHRQEGRRHRGAAQEARQDDGERAASQHRRGPQARARRAAGGRVDRPAARAAGVVPPRHEAGRAERHAHGRARHPGQRVGPPRRRRDRPDRVVPRGARAAAHAARRHRLCAGRGQDALRDHRREGLDLPRRDPRA